MNLSTIILGLCASALPLSYGETPAPKPFGAIPTKSQVDWQRTEFYTFIHFGLNTWTGQEWGYGDGDPNLFNPPHFDADKTVELYKKGGFKGIIFAAKHHDGFCLWPTKTTPFNITKSPWKDGKGDVVKEWAEACKKHGLKFGVYISPWDRNHAEYGKEGYLKTFYAQVEELLTQYGPIFEIWFDGANEKTGYYGGAKESRSISQNYYEYDKLIEKIHQLQPNCIVWGAQSRGDARWGGSEQGFVGYPHWHTLGAEKTGEHIQECRFGIKHGGRWVPAEADAPIRHGWFTHEKYNNTVKSPEKLMEIWLQSVGRGANLLLNVAPDKTGTVYPADAKALIEFKDLRDQFYAQDFALKAKTKTTNTRANDAKFSGAQLVDNDIETYWATDDNVTQASVELDLKQKTRFDAIRLREQIRLGQRVEKFSVDIWENGAWKTVVQGESIGNQSIFTLPQPVTTNKIRLNILESGASPCISELSLLELPKPMPKPGIHREGKLVKIDTIPGQDIYYTLNGSSPDKTSTKYSQPISLPNGGTVTARIINKQGKLGPESSLTSGMSKQQWKIVGKLSPEQKKSAQMAIDDKENTMWVADNKDDMTPQSITVEMNQPIIIDEFSYLPRQDHQAQGLTNKYVFEVSEDGKNWVNVAEGEFSNLRANPIEQLVKVKPTQKPVKFFRFTATNALEKGPYTVGEISIFAKKK